MTACRKTDKVQEESALKDTSSKVISEETYPHVLNEESYMEWWDDKEVEILPDAVRKAEVRDDGYMQSEFYASLGGKVYFIHEGERSQRDTEPCVYRFLSCYDIDSDNKSESWCVDLFLSFDVVLKPILIKNLKILNRTYALEYYKNHLLDLTLY